MVKCLLFKLNFPRPTIFIHFIQALGGWGWASLGKICKRSPAWNALCQPVHTLPCYEGHCQATLVPTYLYRVFWQGNKPDFHLAMGGEESKLLYEQLLAGLRKGYKEDKIQTGVFGAMMQVGAFDLVHHWPSITTRWSWSMMDQSRWNWRRCHQVRSWMPKKSHQLLLLVNRHPVD